jgi:hypothetical protein
VHSLERHQPPDLTRFLALQSKSRCSAELMNMGPRKVLDPISLNENTSINKLSAAPKMRVTQSKVSHSQKTRPAFTGG